jgi:cytidine deaminase
MTIPQQDKGKLIERAMSVRAQAYAPYSNYHVGASLLTNTGEIFDGVNVENASYTVGICAERNAVFQAVAHNQRSFRAIVVATDNGGSPCGACRQVLSEFGLDIEVITLDSQGNIIMETTVAKLLPQAFGPEHLTQE